MADTVPATPRVVKVRTEPLTPEAFAEFGWIVGTDETIMTSTEFPMYTNLVDLPPVDAPISYVNRHHDHNQLFATLGGQPMIVVVASPRLSAAELRPEDIRAFVTDGNTAVVFHIDTWHNAPQAVGRESIRALNVQASNYDVHTEVIDLAPTFGYVLQLETPRR